MNYKRELKIGLALSTLAFLSSCTPLTTGLTAGLVAAAVGGYVWSEDDKADAERLRACLDNEGHLGPEAAALCQKLYADLAK